MSAAHCASRRGLLVSAMGPPQLFGVVLQLDGLLQQAVVAVPLDEVGAAHEGCVLAGAAVVVPEVEVGEVDGVGEGRSGERAVLVQAVDDVLGGQNLGVGIGDDLLGLCVDAVDRGPECGIACRPASCWSGRGGSWGAFR